MLVLVLKSSVSEPFLKEYSPGMRTVSVFSVLYGEMMMVVFSLFLTQNVAFGLFSSWQVWVWVFWQLRMTVCVTFSNPEKNNNFWTL